MLFSGMNTVAEAGRTEAWRKRYLASRYQKEFVAGRSGTQPDARGKTGEEKPRRPFGLTQWVALVKRNVIVKLQDRAQTAILLAQAPFFAAGVGPNEKSGRRSPRPEGDKLAAENLAAAATTMSRSPVAMQLRTLQTIDGAGPYALNTVLIAVPVEADGSSVKKQTLPS